MNIKIFLRRVFSFRNAKTAALALAGIAVFLFALSYGLLAYEQWKGRQGVENLAKALKQVEEESYKQAMADTYGGKTPQETLQMYIEAVEKGDFELASKYFIGGYQEKELKSLKNSNPEERQEMLIKYSIGDELDCEVAGIVEFGIFLKIEEGLEGLVHISEMDWALVENPKTMFQIGEKIKVKIIEIKDGKVSLSIKALKENPWKDAEKKYKKDDVVDGVIIKFNKHGALASIEEGIAGLVHISEFGSDEKLHAVLELGKNYKFKITLFDAKEQKMTLSFVDPNKKESSS